MVNGKARNPSLFSEKLPIPTGLVECPMMTFAHDEAHEPMSDIVQRILVACSHESRSTPDLLQFLSYETLTGNFKRALSRLLALGCLEMTIPDKPWGKKQKYPLTEKGPNFLTTLRKE